MSKPWKGWMRPMDKWGPDGDDDRIGVNRPVKDRREANYRTPVIVTPIDDESLPHPGDGKEWITKGGTSVEILSAPAEGVVIVKGEGIWGGSPCGYDVDSLRERKPEPEHRPWCERNRDKWSDDPEWALSCWCHPSHDPRSGEDRRQGDRRRGFNAGSYRVASDIRWGRRSGEDRRSP